MIGHLPIISFDTSAHNRLLRDSSRSEAVLAGIKSGLFFRFAGLSIEELVATPDPTIRAALSPTVPVFNTDQAIVSILKTN